MGEGVGLSGSRTGNDQTAAARPPDAPALDRTSLLGD
jgi:hypothetical protein